jgi:hypothetical protein
MLRNTAPGEQTLSALIHNSQDANYMLFKCKKAI